MLALRVPESIKEAKEEEQTAVGESPLVLVVWLSASPINPVRPALGESPVWPGHGNDTGRPSLPADNQT